MIVTLQTERIHTLEQVAAFVQANAPVDFSAHGPGECLRVRGADAVAPRVPRTRQAIEGAGEALSGEDDELFACPADAPDPPVSRDGQGGGPPRRQPGPAVRAGLHAGRRAPAGAGGRRPSARCRAWRRGSCCSASSTSSATRASSAWRGSRQATSTICGHPGPTAHSARWWRGRRRARWACAARRSPVAGRASCASTPCTRATATAPGACTWSTSSTRSRSTSTSARSRTSPSASWCRCSKPCSTCSRSSLSASHADNGSEYVNHTVAALLNKLNVRDFTKSRPRRSTDNALVEGKNASVVRRFLGHEHIPAALRASGRRVRTAAPVAAPQLPPALPVRHRAQRRQRSRQRRQRQPRAACPASHAANDPPSSARRFRSGAGRHASPYSWWNARMSR